MEHGKMPWNTDQMNNIKMCLLCKVFKRKKKFYELNCKKKKEMNCKNLKSTEDFDHVKQHPIKQTSEPALTN